jgi:hypothetical protein
MNDLMDAPILDRFEVQAQERLCCRVEIGDVGLRIEGNDGITDRRRGNL